MNWLHQTINVHWDLDSDQSAAAAARDATRGEKTGIVMANLSDLMTAEQATAFCFYFFISWTQRKGIMLMKMSASI